MSTLASSAAVAEGPARHGPAGDVLGDAAGRAVPAARAACACSEAGAPRAAGPWRAGGRRAHRRAPARDHAGAGRRARAVHMVSSYFKYVSRQLTYHTGDARTGVEGQAVHRAEAHAGRGLRGRGQPGVLQARHAHAAGRRQGHLRRAQGQGGRGAGAVSARARAARRARLVLRLQSRARLA